MATLDQTEMHMLQALRYTIKTMTQEAGVKTISEGHSLNGAFKQLLDKKLMVQLLFPGTDAHTLSLLPKDLKEILEWRELSLDLMKIAKSGATVLRNIKASGARQGDVMDDATERGLIPQIAQEALGKGVIESVRGLNRSISKMNSKIHVPIASIETKEAGYDQLDDDAIIRLKEDSKHKFAVQYDFMGEESEIALIQLYNEVIHHRMERDCEQVFSSIVHKSH
jgi:hypothetical protein